ncbi:alkane 1-monooxygenase [Marinobacter sp. NP-6]|uniref:alkane 1-monooxygenase n=1 Tax=Marinobacter sp. NP-6 TaxID=2488666 RepID=UPI000FCA8E45|nr:alkane 1-monooxygenase [Marinobacter sp. NP-6]RUT76925.1 alkane 1-monooxygenase [Marinobacter sp. NP-6]
MDYLKYYLPVLVQVAALAGLLFGGNWVWVGVATFPALAILDSLLPKDYSPRRMRNKKLALVPVWICTLLGPILYIALAYSVVINDLTGWQMLGAVLSVAWMSVLPLVPSSHELYHQRDAFSRFVGRYAQVCYLDCTRDIGHVVTHHIHVGTTKDSDTAPRGMSLYSFAPDAVIKTTLDCQRTESDALEKRGLGRWSIHHRLWKAILAQLVFQVIIFYVGGWQANALSLAAMTVARFWIETFNYFQHYGQVRVPGTPIEKRHVWNHLAPLSRIMTFEITNHADHHLNSFQPYYALVPDQNAIRLPNVFVCFWAALIPPVWYNFIIKPALEKWDNEFASSEERELARAQNEKAGWPDWFDATGDANLRTS